MEQVKRKLNADLQQTKLFILCPITKSTSLNALNVERGWFLLRYNNRKTTKITKLLQLPDAVSVD